MLHKLAVWMLIGLGLFFGGLPLSAQTQEPTLVSPGCSTYGVRYETGSPIPRVLQFEGIDRHYIVYVPTIYHPAEPTPLVFNLHGFASHGEQQMTVSHMNEVAEAYNFITVYPNGTGFPLRWAAYMTGQFAAINSNVVDDVGFIRALIDSLRSEYCIDPARIYASGLSNGGGMANRLACDLSDQIAAIGTVAGAYPPLDSPCNPVHAMPVIAFHGDADPIVPYLGDMSGFPAIQEWAAAWAQRDGCDSTPTTMPPSGDVTGVHYGNCQQNAEVILYTIGGGGHTWPGGASFPMFITGATSADIDASRVMWLFFAAHPMPSGN